MGRGRVVWRGLPSGRCGFESHQGHNFKNVVRGVFRPKSAPTQGWECYNPNGKAGTTQSSIIRFKDTSLRVLLSRPTPQVQTFPGPVNAGIYYDSKRGRLPCQVVSNRNGNLQQKICKYSFASLSPSYPPSA